jgi:hypothetical protein
MLARTPEDRRYVIIANKIDELNVAVDSLKELVKELRPQRPAKQQKKSSEPAN